MSNKDYSIKDMKRADWIWQGAIVVEVFVLAIGLVLGTGVADDSTRKSIGDLVKALFSSGDAVESEMWIWIARISCVALIATVAWYVKKVKPHTVG